MEIRFIPLLFLRKGRIQPFVYLSIGFWLATAWQYWSSMSSNLFVFHTSGDISWRLAGFFFLTFLNTKPGSSCVKSPSLMSSWSQIILTIWSSVTLEGFPSKLSKYCFHRCFCSSSLSAFAVLFILLTSITICHAILNSLSSTECLILLIWFWMYFVCSFGCTLVYFVPF